MHKMENKKYKHKPHFCIFCKTDQKRIHEHILRKHADEERVKEIVNTTDKKERFWMWKRLSQEGDSVLNNEDQSEMLTPKRLVKELHFASGRRKYYECPRCAGRLRTSCRSMHKYHCSRILKPKKVSPERDIFEGIPELQLNKIRGSKYLIHFIQDVHQMKNNRKIVRDFVTDLTGLEDEMRKVTNSKKFLIEFLTAQETDNFIRCIKNLCVEQEKGNEKIFKYPCKAQRLCRTMGSLCKFLILYYTKRDMEKSCSDVEKFQKVFEHEAEKFIKKQALKSIHLRKLQNPTPILKTTDISILIKKLKEETVTLMEELKTKPNAKNWRLLAENLLCRLTIFNRRRGGAVEKMSLEDYNRKELNSKISMEEAMFDLNEEDRKFLEEIRVVEIIHKCNNIVPILIVKDIKEAIDTLILMRKHGDINPKNEFVFAASRKSVNPISCGKVIEKYRKILLPGIRELLTATNLRKHGATAAQVLDLTEKDSEEWATHMGHSLKVHKQYYRKNELTASVLKTARILSALDNGTIKFFKGKKLEEIPLRQNIMDDSSMKKNFEDVQSSEEQPSGPVKIPR